jgi:ADP-ribosyl-[dinitrogen reductase] hydrolase
VDPGVVRDRSRGALLGLAVGDALGTTNELKQFLTADFSIFLEGPQREMKGGGPFNLVRGQVTDDTQMACCIAWTLREMRRYDAADVLERYHHWLQYAFDVGAQIKAVLQLVHEGMLPRVASRDFWLQSAKRAAGNGSLMRTAPIGVYLAQDRNARIRASIDDCVLTHYDPRCQLACVAFNAAIASAITSLKPPTADAMVAAALSDLTVAGALLGKEALDGVRDIKSAIEFLRQDLELAKTPDPELYGPELFLHRQVGFVRVAFRLAFWELCHAPNLETALVDVVNRGGDTDTNAALTGALFGALQGEGAVPEEWRLNVLEALFNKEGPLVDRYHPNQLLALVD